MDQRSLEHELGLLLRAEYDRVRSNRDRQKYAEVLQQLIAECDARFLQAIVDHHTVIPSD